MHSRDERRGKWEGEDLQFYGFFTLYVVYEILVRVNEK